jgi:hypothetical protein
MCKAGKKQKKTQQSILVVYEVSHPRKDGKKDLD